MTRSLPAAARRPHLLRPVAWLLAALTVAGLSACAGRLAGASGPALATEASPASLAAPASANSATSSTAAPCCTSLALLPVEGALRRDRDLRLDARSPVFAFDTGASPVSVWRFEDAPSGQWLEFLVDDQTTEAGQIMRVPMIRVLVADAFGQPLPVRLIGPMTELSGKARLRWWLDLPGAADRLVVGLDASAVGQRRSLVLIEPQPPQRISGIVVNTPDKRTPLPVQVIGEGRIKLILHRS